MKPLIAGGLNDLRGNPIVLQLCQHPHPAENLDVYGRPWLEEEFKWLAELFCPPKCSEQFGCGCLDINRRLGIVGLGHFDCRLNLVSGNLFFLVFIDNDVKWLIKLTEEFKEIVIIGLGNLVIFKLDFFPMYADASPFAEGSKSATESLFWKYVHTIYARLSPKNYY